MSALVEVEVVAVALLVPRELVQALALALALVLVLVEQHWLEQTVAQDELDQFLPEHHQLQLALAPL